MKDIILESARLIATDDESKRIIERLRSEGVYGQEDKELLFVYSGRYPFTNSGDTRSLRR